MRDEAESSPFTAMDTGLGKSARNSMIRKIASLDLEMAYRLLSHSICGPMILENDEDK